jgi:cbb3-type cytochrome oxidase subunit 3
MTDVNWGLVFVDGIVGFFQSPIFVLEFLLLIAVVVYVVRKKRKKK